MVQILGKDYSEKEWKSALKSNKGLFRRLKEPPKNIVGPTLVKTTDDEGDMDVVGDVGAMEMADISLCGERQQFVFHYLVKADYRKAVEYAFIITNADVVWKKKIELLRNLLQHIKFEEDQILSEEAVVEKAKKIKGNLIDRELEKYFPEDFKKLREDIADLERFATDLDKFGRDLQRAESHLEAVEKRIKDHLAHIEASFPFLFN